MTMAVVWLLKIPGLLLAGGALLLWIAVKLMTPTNDHGEDGVDASTTFLGAMKTIVIADAVMGVDNVLAVAGAAHGSYLLVVLGLLISVPIVVWGSTLLLKLTERFPAIVMLGAGVLAFTGVKMALSEPLLKPWLADLGHFSLLAYVLGVGGVMLIGTARQSNGKLGHALRGHQARFALPDAPISEFHTEGETTMNKILVPIDGSENSMDALRHVLRTNPADALQVLVLNVQPLLTRHISRFVSAADRDAWRQERADSATHKAREELQRHRVSYAVKVALGSRVDAITQTAQDESCTKIVLGTAR
jgi:YjbE family integral membrane protein